MKIAVLSGKGGTGKTMLSVNIASLIGDCTYIDCDVEEPNGGLFFKPEIYDRKKVSVLLPKQDETKCTGCRKCVDFCKFNALCYVNKKVFVFNEVCHSCEGCKMLCEAGAISMVEKVIGEITVGKHDKTRVVSGILNLGEASGVPIIKQLITNYNDKSVVIDCPPGSACVVMESIKDADYCVLVAEPTVFGVHNLEMVYNLVKIFNKNFAVVINKAIKDETIVEDFCKKHSIKVLGRIAWDSELAKLSSNGEIAVNNSKYHKIFSDIYSNILEDYNATVSNT